MWTVAHLWNNLSAFKGGVAWQTDVTEYGQLIATADEALYAAKARGRNCVVLKERG